MIEKNTKFNVGESAIKRVQRNTMLKKQRIAIVISAVAILLLVAALLAVMYFIKIYQFPDVDGKEYNIKQINGIYELCYKNGEIVHRTDDGYYQTDAGTLVTIDPTTGEYSIYAVVDTYATEEEYYQNILLFAGMTYNAGSQRDESKVVKTLEIYNEHGSFTFERKDSGNNYSIKGHEKISYDTEKFVSLIFACGQPIANMKLENPVKLSDGSIDYKEYGLESEMRTVIEVNEDGEEVEVQKEYKPAYFVITALNGDRHKIIVGDKTVTGEGRYAIYAGGETFDKNGSKTVWEKRDTVYIINNSQNALGYSGIEEFFLGRVEDMVTPMIVYPMASNNYFNVHDFVIYKDIDYNKIYDMLVEKYGDPDSIEEGSIDEEEFNEFYAQAFEASSKKVCHFSYQDMEIRSGRLNTYMPYVSHLDYADGYYINSTNIDTVIYAMYATEFTKIEKLNPTEDELSDVYGFGSDDENIDNYIISYLYNTTEKDSEGREKYIENYVQISKKDGVFYAYSDEYDMVVSVSESSFGFLEWEEIEWYDSNYIQMDLGFVTDIKFESSKINVSFFIDDSASRYMKYYPRTGSSFAEQDTNKQYNIVKDPLTGKYVLSSDNAKVQKVYDGDYFISGMVYNPGVAENDQYLFVETEPIDINGDGNNDYTAYYFYNVALDSTTGKRYLAAQIALADANGNKVAEEEFKSAQLYFATDYFITKSGYLFLVNKNSNIGNQLTEKYAKYGRGGWGSGNVFGTSDGKYVLVDSQTGNWSILDSAACGVYFCDSANSQFAKRAITIPNIYSGETVSRYGDTYYPLTDEDLEYDESTGAIMVYDRKNKLWNKYTYDDCTIGAWGTGAYYVTEGGNIVAVDSETGDWGIITVSTNENYVAEVFANGEVLDYVIPTTNHVGTQVNSSAMDNFKQFYGAMLYASFEGMAELTDEEKEALKALDDFSDDDPNNPCQLKITLNAEDFYGGKYDIVFRFYQYTERKSYITIERIDYASGEASSSTKAYGNFCVLRSFVDKLIEDAIRIVNAQEVTAVTKY